MVASMNSLSKFQSTKLLLGRGFAFENPDPRLLHDIIHNFLQVAGFTVNLKLAISACTHFEHFVNVVDLITRAQFVHDVVYEMEVLMHKVHQRYFLFLAEVDELALESIP